VEIRGRGLVIKEGAMGRYGRPVILLTLILMLVAPGAVQAQWVFLARKGLKIINSIASQGQSPSQAQGQGVDAATVLLDADADKVYNVAVKLLRDNPDVHILWQDDAKRAIAFSKGDQSASMKVSGLNDNLSQILVASTFSRSSGTSLVVERILRVCKQMGVECTQAQD
jgi:hypothetical protein